MAQCLQAASASNFRAELAPFTSNSTVYLDAFVWREDGNDRA